MSETREPSILAALAPTAAAASATSLRRECRRNALSDEPSSPMRPPMTREGVLALIEMRLAAGTPDAWLLRIERDVLIAIGRQSPRSGW